MPRLRREDEGRSDTKADRNQVASGVTLYELKYITQGRKSDVFKKADKKLLSGM